MIVIDASALAEILAQSAVGAALERRLSGIPHAPHLIDIEVTNCIRGRLIGGLCSEEEAARVVEQMTHLPLVRHPHTSLLPAVWLNRHNLTAYDAVYLELARSLGASLMTLDDGLAKTAKRTGVRVIA